MNRKRLVHVVPELRVNGISGFVVELSKALPQYAHTLLYETPIGIVGANILWCMLAAGLDVQQCDSITEETLLTGGYSGAIMYNVVGHSGLGIAIPSVYYSYGVWDKDVACDATVACSTYAANTGRYGTRTEFPHHRVIPPMLDIAAMGLPQKEPAIFTVGILTSGAYDKYPCKFVIDALRLLPAEMGVLVSQLPKYIHPGVELALAARWEAYPHAFGKCPVVPGLGVHYLNMVDALLYASAPTHNEPYGRLVMEAMALGKPVVCEQRGALPTLLEDEKEVLFFNTVEEAVLLTRHLERDTVRRERMVANARLRAAQEDTTKHIGEMESLLRDLGI